MIMTDRDLRRILRLRLSLRPRDRLVFRRDGSIDCVRYLPRGVSVVTIGWAHILKQQHQEELTL